MNSPRHWVTRSVGAIRTTNRALHYVAGVALMALLVLTVTDVIGRSQFNSPVAGTVELTPLLLVIVVYLGFAHAQHEGDHIAVDLVYSRMGRRGRRASTFFSQIVTVVIMVVVTKQLWEFAGVQENGGYTTAVLEWEIHWFVRIATLGAALLLLATLTEVVADLAGVDRQVPDEAESSTHPSSVDAP